MVLESTMICVDNSDFMRNGDFVPTRLQAQQDAVNLVCHSKTRSNPENNVGLITMSSSSPEVMVTLTADVGRVLSRLHQVQPCGNIRFSSGVKVAHLALKHRQGKNHRMRIVCFVGSPMDDDPKELVKLAKRLKKEKVNVDVINFGEHQANSEKLTNFVNTINGKEGTTSHLVTVPPGPMLSDALLSSPIIAGEEGAGAGPGSMQGFEFGIDPNEDPELALALRVSMEEQRARQEDEARKVAAQSAVEAGVPPAVTEESSEEALLKQALEMSLAGDDDAEDDKAVDLDHMTEEQQIAYAMQMSLAADAEEMDTESGDADGGDESYLQDMAFLQSVLEGLPGVDPQSEAIRSAMGQLTQPKDDKGDKDSKDKDKDSDKK